MAIPNSLPPGRRLGFNLKVNKLYSELPENQRTAMTVDQYRNGQVVPEVDAYLNKRQAQFPAITPEKLSGNKSP